MKIDEIRELKEMGFSNQEILQLATTGEVTRTIETPEQPEQPAPAAPEQPEQPAPVAPAAPEQPEQPVPAATDKTIDELKQTISSMQNEMKSFISTMQKNNLQSATFDMLPNETLEENAVASLSELIRPTINEGGNKK